jgi:hypothetical protein
MKFQTVALNLAMFAWFAYRFGHQPALHDEGDPVWLRSHDLAHRGSGGTLARKHGCRSALAAWRGLRLSSTSCWRGDGPQKLHHPAWAARSAAVFEHRCINRLIGLQLVRPGIRGVSCR